MQDHRIIAIAVAVLFFFCHTSSRADTFSITSTNPLIFANTIVGSSSTETATLSITITGSGEQEAGMLFQPSLSAPFSLAGESCSNTGCTATIKFSPNAATSFMETVTPTLETCIASLQGCISGTGPSTSAANLVLEGTGIPATTPLPAALPLFATGLGALGLLGWRRKRKAQA